MGRYRVNVTFAPAGGRRLRHDEIVEIDDEDLVPYGAFLHRGWLTRLPDAPELVRSEHGNVQAPTPDELVPVDDPDVVLDGDPADAEPEGAPE